MTADEINRGKITGDIVVQESVTMRNFGDIYGDINIDHGNIFKFQNSGNFLGQIITHGNARFIQIISGPDDIQKLDVIGNFYSVDVIDANGLHFMDLVNVARDAEMLNISNSTLYFNLGDTSSVPVNFIGDFNTLIVSGVDAAGEYLLMSDVTFDSMIYLELDGNDDMYYFTTRYDDGHLFLIVERTKDYDRIFKDTKYVNFLNRFRARNSAAAARIDSATDTESIDEILSGHYEFNPMILFDSLRTLNAMREFSGDSFSYMGMIGKNADTTMSSAGISNENFELHIHYGRTTGTDFENEFYGVSAAMQFEFSNTFVSGGASATYAKFKTNEIWTKGDISQNPNGKIAGAFAEFGGIVNIGDGARIKPLVRIRGDYAKILDAADFSYFPGIGLRTEYAEETRDMKSEYGFVVIREREFARIGATLRWTSLADGIMFGIDGGFIKSNGENFIYGGANLSVYF
ncbi:MAG: autotransporter domain-containing protein [Rickettsiales bacterium]|nr:autotransporter domain-containing protein [Rickettsiales bacterium]